MVRSGIALVALLWLIAAAASAGEVAWTGTAGSDFEAGGNWAGGAPPSASVASDLAVFSGSAAHQPALSAGRGIGGLDFRSAGWTLSGAPGQVLAVGTGGLASAGAGANTVSADISVAAPAAWSAGTGNTLGLTGLVGGSGALVKCGAGTVSLTNAGNTLSGPIRVDAGRLQAVGGALGTSQITLHGGTLALQAAAARPAGLLVQYTFDDAMATDVSGHGRDGFLQNGGSLSAGVFHTGPGNGFIQMPDLSAQFAAGAGTLNLWLKNQYAVNPDHGQAAFAVGLDGTGLSSYYPWSGTGQGYFSTFRSSRVEGVELSAAVDRTQWHMVTIVSDPADPAHGWRLYQNGLLVTDAAPAWSLTQATWRLGSSVNCHYDGWIDNFSLFNQALTAEAIQDLLAAGKDPRPSPNFANDIAISADSTLEASGLAVVGALTLNQGVTLTCTAADATNGVRCARAGLAAGASSATLAVLGGRFTAAQVAVGAGTLAVRGNLAFGQTGGSPDPCPYLVSLAGTGGAAGRDFGQLAITGDGDLSAGKVIVSLPLPGKGFSPDALKAESLAIVTVAGARSGQFLTVERDAASSPWWTVNAAGALTYSGTNVLLNGSAFAWTAAPGDATLDGKVNVTDLGVLSNHYGQTVADWTLGDFNFDGLVNVTDLGVLSNHYGQTAVPAAPAGEGSVPEPATLALWVLGGLAAVRRKRK